MKIAGMPSAGFVESKTKLKANCGCTKLDVLGPSTENGTPKMMPNTSLNEYSTAIRPARGTAGDGAHAS